ncbi:MAG: SOS response-associated peptidase [Planctomycetes bacterium]|nr:SOS response-associated peptidase [Planctomycetota bacterium]
MCGRFALRASAENLIKIFRLLRVLKLDPRYNIAPTQPVAAVRQLDAQRELVFLHWGLIPSWSKDPKLGARMINARSETVATKPSFRSAFKSRRCLIPADGFYEWKRAEKKTKQPYFIGLKNEEPFAFAGLWEHWESGDGSAIDSCTIITTEANDLLRNLHDRMPVILSEEDYDRWLDPKSQNRDALQSLLVPFPSAEMRFSPVGTIVNNARNETPDCVKPVKKQETLFPED